MIRESDPGSGRYYLDNEVWQAVRSTRRRMVLIVLAVALVALTVAFAGSTAVFNATYQQQAEAETDRYDPNGETPESPQDDAAQQQQNGGGDEIREAHLTC